MHLIILLRSALLLLTGGGFLLAPVAVFAEGDPRLGRLYYRSICTDCHVAQIGNGIPPNDRTIAEWRNYLSDDRHAPGSAFESRVSDYTSQAHRESIKEHNLVAQRFLSVSDEQMFANVRAWLVSSAKDSDRPAGCD